MKRLIICPQSKGGIGKSTAAIFTSQYLNHVKAQHQLYDLDDSNSTTHAMLPNANFLAIQTADDIDKLDELGKALDQHNIILVDLKATMGGVLHQWLETRDFAAYAKEIGAQLTFMLMAVDDADAMTQLVNVVDRYNDQPRYVVFRNRGVRTSLIYETSDVRKKLQSWKSPEVQIEKLPTALHNQMVLNSHTVTAAIESKEYHPLERSNLRRLLRSIYAEFEKAQAVLLP
ncbi:hypothetical protein OAG63_00630 [Methylacidiphilales bacterium]|nr:hypothetical protein [Candidatus Methylacidiphilales bacterium]